MRFENRWAIIAVAVLLVVAPVGCKGERYQLGETEDGETIRLDTKTGEVMVIRGARMVPVISPGVQTPVSEERGKEIAADIEMLKAKFAAWAEPKDWPTLTRPSIGFESVNLTTRLVSGHLADLENFQYKFSVEPLTRWLNRDRSYWPEVPFALKFFDKDNFEIFSVPIPRANISIVIGASGNRDRLNAQGRAMFPIRSSYEEIVRWSFSWSE